MQQIFWRENPALLLSISFVLGASSFLFWGSPWNYIFPSLWFFYLLYLGKGRFIIALLSAFLYSWILYGKAPHLENPQQVKAVFSIRSFQAHHSPFQKGFVYQGTIYLNQGAFPCSIYYRGKEAPSAAQDYLIEGKLIQRAPYDYILSPKKWTPLKGIKNLAELRYRMKERFQKFLNEKLNSRSAKFLGALITGNLEDRQLRYEFGKLGLQHILAISGFHFAALIAFCSFALNLILPRFWKILALLCAINLYFFFIGPLPAVERSWFAAQLYLIAKLLKKEPSALNLLGCAMCLEICLDPLVCGHIGFQLSFLSCTGILLLYAPFEKHLRRYLPKRNREEIMALNIFSKHAYLLSAFLRKTVSLSLAVNCAILPLLLYHFHQFPLLGLFYNLFFPLFVSLSLFLTLIALSLSFLIPLFAPPLFALTNRWTTYLLDLASYPPPSLDYSLYSTSFPSWLIPFYLFAILTYSCQTRGSSNMIFSHERS